MSAPLSPLAATVLARVNERDHVSFAELANDLPAFKDGDLMWELLDNLIVWVGMTKAATDAIDELRSVPWVFFQPSSVLVYAIDGGLLKMPIAKRMTAYKSPRWLPTVIRPIARATPKQLREIAVTKR